MHIFVWISFHRQISNFSTFLTGLTFLTGDIQKLIKKRKNDNDPILYYACAEMYSIVMRVYVFTGHGGRDKMLKETNIKFANVTRDVLGLFKVM